MRRSVPEPFEIRSFAPPEYTPPKVFQFFPARNFRNSRIQIVLRAPSSRRCVVTRRARQAYSMTSEALGPFSRKAGFALGPNQTERNITMLCHKTIRVSCLLAGTLFLSFSASAQEGKGEVTGFGGAIAIGSGGGTHKLFGGSAGVRVTEHLRVFGEFAVAPIASMSGSAEGVNYSASERIYDFGGGIDYSFGDSQRFVPYVLTAAGLGRDSASANASGLGGSLSLSTNQAYLGFGGGARIYAGRNWGFKPEVRFQRYANSSGGANTAVVTGGIFFQFGK